MRFEARAEEEKSRDMGGFVTKDGRELICRQVGP